MARKKKIIETPVNVNLNEIYPRPIGEVMTEAYLDIGNYVNNHRHMAEVKDGCKVSYRRLLWASLQFPKGKLIPATNLIASVANYHPHSLTGIEGLNATLVNSGVFTGEGSFGFTSITGTDNPPAAPRYLKNRLSDLYWDIIGDLIKYVPKVESPVGPLEPEYIPSPLPLCMILAGRVSGLGFGLSTIYPNFSPKSLYTAYINNDPSLLEPNVDLEIDKKKSDLLGLWRYGKGKVTYSYHITRVSDPATKREGVLFSGSTALFTPKLSKFKKLIEEGKVYFDDLTDFDGPKLFVGRVPGARGITVDDIWGIAEKIKSDSTTYVLNVTDSKMAYRIPLFNWLDYMYKNYIQLITYANNDKIQKVTFDIDVQKAIPLVVDYITNKNPKATDKEISKNLGIPEEIIASVMSKPISNLRKNKDTTEKVKALKSKLSELKKFNPTLFTEKIIGEM